jgi:Right handed beta helix region/G8 domain
MADKSPNPDDGPAKRLYQRREVIALVGLGGVAAGFGLAKVLSDDGGEAPPSGGPASTTRATDEPAPSTVASPSPGSRPPDTAPADTPPERPEEVPQPQARWSDPESWGGELPSEADVATIDKPVLLDVDAAVSGVRIEPQGALVFDPSSSRRLASSGNLVVAGRLVVRPADAAVLHQIEFVNVDEAAFRGGHTEEPFDEDVGLWVVGAGLLDVHGTPKTAWTRLAGEANAGDGTIAVDDATGWQVGDEVVVTPTEPTTVEDHWTHHDRRVIASIDGKQITLDRPLEHPHPTVTVRPEVVHRAEVLNLTRNVVIGGTPEGRSHVIMLTTTAPQQILHAGLRHMGPRQGDDEEVLGRYAIHFHGDGDGSRGSLVEGVAVYDSTGHAFAAHLSDGVTFRDCVAHDLVDDAYWWDLSLDGGGRHLVPSNDILYERCVAHFVKSGANSKFNLTGFLMGAGEGNVARGCVATGVQGGAESSAGFHWPSHSRDDHTWTFEDNIAHNNHHSGIYFWQNGAPRTIVDRFTAYHCGMGIFAGSYANLASYRDCTIYACEKAGLVISALPAKKGERTGETITYEGMYVDQAGLTDYAVHITKHLARGGRVTLISGSTFLGGRVAQIGIPEGGDHPQLYDITDCTFEGNEFWLADDVSSDTQLNVRDSSAGSFIVRPADQPGELREEWNASVTEA